MRARSTTGLVRFGVVLVRQFRYTLLALALSVVVGSALYAVTPHAAPGGQRPPLLTAAFGAWMALFAQPIYSPPETWYLALLCGVYPLLGFGLVGEGMVRLGMLMFSKQHGEKEWMRVMAQVEKDHIVLC